MTPVKDKQGYDIIGDIHGHADELQQLLVALGYQHGIHPTGRKVIFLGDYIDRGPQIKQSLQIVRGMVESGNALAILGNHEVNAMRFHARGHDGNFLRPHTEKNVSQHAATLRQIPDKAEWAEWIKWFAGLPIYLDLCGFRVVHACWDDKAVSELAQIGRLEGPTLEKYSLVGSPEHEMISRVLNGPEALLPPSYEHLTADGTMRRDIRVQWWINLHGLTCREAIFPEDPEIPALPLQNVPITAFDADSPPTFFGHYAIKAASPRRVRHNLACLDYGTGKGGFLCAYRWDGECEIDNAKFVTVGNSQV